jgi:putrescine transport system permease protein
VLEWRGADRVSQEHRAQRWLTRRPGLSGRGAVIAVPYLWLLLFLVLPFAIVLKISLSEALLAMPPYSPLFSWSEEAVLAIHLDFSNFLFLFEDDLYWLAYLNSSKIAFISTLGCLAIGYPVAYGMARSAPKLRSLLLMLVILPFWTSFLLRAYAWMGILSKNGVVNNALIALGFIDEPIVMMRTDFAVYLGIIYTYLPFMILPLYANLERLDSSLLEAAADLGSHPFTTFVRVTLPLSVPGIVAGSLLVFIPAVGEFVIPALLGGPDTLMIGRVLWDEFFSNRDWPVASAVAIAILLMLVIPTMIFQHFQATETEIKA